MAKGNANSDGAEDNVVTWEEITRIEQKTISLEKYDGKTITYLNKIPLDKAIALETRYMKQGASDTLGFMVAILKEVLVRPALTEDALRAVMKADASLVMGIFTDVMGKGRAEAIAKGLGEGSPTSPSTAAS